MMRQCLASTVRVPWRVAVPAPCFLSVYVNPTWQLIASLLPLALLQQRDQRGVAGGADAHVEGEGDHRVIGFLWERLRQAGSHATLGAANIVYQIHSGLPLIDNLVGMTPAVCPMPCVHTPALHW